MEVVDGKLTDHEISPLIGPDADQGLAEEPGCLAGAFTNWAVLSITTMLCFCCGNLCITQLSDLGIHAIFYFNTGALLVVGVYVYGSTREGVLKRTIERFDGPKGSSVKRDLLRDFEGNFDFTMLAAILLCAFGQFAVFATIMETFRLSRLAGLNAGISQACWASLSFFNALVDLIFFG